MPEPTHYLVETRVFLALKKLLESLPLGQVAELYNLLSASAPAPPVSAPGEDVKEPPTPLEAV